MVGVNLACVDKRLHLSSGIQTVVAEREILASALAEQHSALHMTGIAAGVSRTHSLLALSIPSSNRLYMEVA